MIVPSLAKAGFSCGILSGRPRPGASSVSTTVSPARPLIVTGTISSLNPPLSIAALARLQALDGVIVHLLRGSADIRRRCTGRSCPSRGLLHRRPRARRGTCGRRPCHGRCARRSGASSAGRGRWSSISMPPATMTSALPVRIASSPMITVCMPRAADLVDRRRLDRLGQAGLDRRLAGRGLAEAGGKHAAHVDAVDVVAARRRRARPRP